MMYEAMLYECLEHNVLRCNLCNHRCKIQEGKLGICGVRQNRGGSLYSLVYGKIIAEHVDPIEKKPLFNFFPGTTAYSLGTMGCNFRCKHCQNFDISQYPRKNRGEVRGEHRTPEQIVAAAKTAGCQTIAYTYTEPTVFFEFAYDTAVLAQREGLKNIFVSNGYMSADAIAKIAPYLDAVNIDIKAFADNFYKEICSARLKPVLESVRLMKALGVWVEVATLIIPGLNDQPQELRDIAQFINDVGAEIPWHVTQFYPTYRMMDKSRTPLETLRMAREIGIEQGLRYVYAGNVPGEDGENTYCHACGALLIERYGFSLLQNRSENGNCPLCGARIDGIGL